MLRLSIPGYERCKIAKEKPDTPSTQSKIAFASFVDRSAAMAAIQRLNGFQFDVERDCTIRLEFAKADDRSLTKLRDDSRRPNEYFSSLNGVTPETRESKMNISREEIRDDGASLPPCATLFVSGLDSSVQIDSLKAVFQDVPGYVRLGLGKDGTHAFVNFVDTQSSTVALNQLNGTKLGTCTLTLFYAKRSLNQT
eukprot:TRINITY_DN5014_c0_g2_i3.p1 TRINITY_DN5014_c0_g2~~TRINITY_DN5014_c0_g2_i3.p1  ORF type:complete len:196 (+),score=30.75 TRINITY_DN5014_c0_g2_i3:77-664(+)